MGDNPHNPGKDLVINVTENPSEPEQKVFKFYYLYGAYI
jgi:hypothetical protein